MRPLDNPTQPPAMGLSPWLVRGLALALSLLVPATTLQAQTRRGFLSEAIAREATRLASTSIAAQPKVAAPRRSWPARHPVVLGTLVGAGSMAALVAVGRENADGAIMGAWVLGGAGAGALGGAIASAVQTAKLKYTASVDQPDIVAVKRIVARLGIGQGIIVTTVNAQRTRGRIEAIDQDEVVVAPDDHAASVRIPYSEVRSVAAKPVSIGRRVGIATGIMGAIVVSWLACYGAGGCGGVS